MTRDDVVEALTVERYGSQWAARERQRQDERRKLLAVMDEIQREERGEERVKHSIKKASSWL